MKKINLIILICLMMISCVPGTIPPLEGTTPQEGHVDEDETQYTKDSTIEDAAPQKDYVDENETQYTEDSTIEK